MTCLIVWSPSLVVTDRKSSDSLSSRMPGMSERCGGMHCEPQHHSVSHSDAAPGACEPLLARAGQGSVSAALAIPRTRARPDGATRARARTLHTVSWTVTSDQCPALASPHITSPGAAPASQCTHPVYSLYMCTRVKPCLPAARLTKSKWHRPQPNKK